MSEPSSSTFVNRHGRRIKASPEKLTPELSAKPVKSKQKTKSISSLLTRLPKYKWHRISFLGLLIILGAITIILIVVDSSKRGYDRQTALMSRSVADISKRTPSSNEKPSETIRGLTVALSAPTTCQSAGLDVSGWYQPAKTARELCQSSASSYTKLRSQLQKMSAYADYVELLSNLLRAPSAPPSQSQYAIAQDYQQLWVEATEKAKAMSPPAGLEVAHKQTVSRIEETANAWTSLSGAHNNQQASAFQTAEKRLQTAYTDLKTTTEPMKLQLNQLQTEINKTVASIYSE